MSLVRQLVAWQVLDRPRILVFPLVLGVTGREPAFAGYPDVDLELVGSRVLDGRIALLDYRLRGGPTEPRD